MPTDRYRRPRPPALVAVGRWTWAPGSVLRSNWIAVSSALAYLNYRLIALVAIGAVFILLQMVRILAPGGPPAGRGRDLVNYVRRSREDARSGPVV